MNNLFQHRLILSGLLLIAAGSLSFGQNDRYEPWQFERTIPQMDYNFKAGPVYFDLTGHLSLRYSDNINYSNQQPREDVKITPRLTFDGLWEFSPVNSFRARIGVGYDKYLDNDQLDSFRLFLDSNSELAFSFQVGNLTLQLYDRPAYNNDPTDSSFIDSNGQLQTEVDEYRRFENTLGLRGFYELNLLDLDFQLMRYDEIPDGDTFEFREHDEIIAQLRGTRAVAANLTVGVGTSYSETQYNRRVLNNGSSWSFGPFFTWDTSEYLRFSGSANWVESDFTTGGAIEDSSDQSSVNYTLEIRHFLNSYYTHRLVLQQRTGYGFLTNTTESRSATYTNTVSLNEKTELQGTLRYEEGEDSPGQFAESFDRYSIQARTSRILGPKTRVSLVGSLIEKDSSREGLSYDNFRLGAEVEYDF